MKALRYAREVQEIDPEYYDVYTGLGAYSYFLGTLSTVIRPFAFLIGACPWRNPQHVEILGFGK
jgi:hypothetical protein